MHTLRRTFRLVATRDRSPGAVRDARLDALARGAPLGTSAQPTTDGDDLLFVGDSQKGAHWQALRGMVLRGLEYPC